MVKKAKNFLISGFLQGNIIEKSFGWLIVHNISHYQKNFRPKIIINIFIKDNSTSHTH